MQAIFLDNGTNMIKMSSSNTLEVKYVTNYAARTKKGYPLYVGKVIETLPLTSDTDVCYPTDRGYPLRWDLESEIWGYGFNELGANPSKSQLLSTIPAFAPDSVKNAYNAVVFEYYNFASHFRASPPYYASYSPELKDTANGVLLDLSYSGSTSVSFLYSNILPHTLRRNDAGGHLLDFMFGEALRKRCTTGVFSGAASRPLLCSSLRLNGLSLRPSINYALELAFSNINQNFTVSRTLLSSMTEEDIHLAHIGKSNVLLLDQEAFSLSRLILDPSPCLRQAGAADLVLETLSHSPPSLADLAKQNVIVYGGLSYMSELVNTIGAELKDRDSSICVRHAKNPGTIVVDGMREFYSSGAYNTSCVTREMYNEYGSEICNLRFFI